MKVAILIFCFGFAEPLLAFDYFNNKIEYWNQQKPKKDEVNPQPNEKQDTNFDWEKYQNPKNDEFFKEGAYTPPKPLMELARNPSDKNIQNWFAYIETKNKLVAALQTRLQEYLKVNGKTASSEEKELAQEQVAQMSREPIDIKRYRFRLYFESSCPHCRNMLKTMEELRSLGYYIEIHQVDRRRPDYEVPFPLIPASKKDLAERRINSWPTLFVADTSKKVTYRINGYLPKDQVLSVLAHK